MEKYLEIERSIIKKFRKDIWSPFMKAVRTYGLIQENDSIMVCISGGKDSFLLAKCMEEAKKHGKIPFQLHYVVMNPGYQKKNLERIRSNAKLLHLKIEIFDSDIFEVVDRIASKSPCYLCARMRRGCLYKKAKELGCNKIALGHHFNDVIETSLLSMFYGAEIKTMLPKLKSENFSGLELIRPLYLVKEEAIIAWKEWNDLHFLNCACKFTENCIIDEEASKRIEVKKLIQELKKKNPTIDFNIFKALDNINLNCVLGIRKDGKHRSLIENQSKSEENS